MKDKQLNIICEKYYVVEYKHNDITSTIKGCERGFYISGGSCETYTVYKCKHCGETKKVY